MLTTLGQHIYKTCQHVLWPQSCAWCHQHVPHDSGILCANCWVNLCFIGHNNCEICQDILTVKEVNTTLCPSCQLSRPYYDKLYSYVEYDAIISHFITHYKNNMAVSYSNFLAIMASQLWQRIQCDYDDPLLAIMPSHPRTLLQRGFNPIALLAYRNGWANQSFYKPSLLIKKRYTRQQKLLSRQQRLKNLRHSIVVNSAMYDDVKGRIIVVMDDVVTTGVTLNIAAEQLKYYGAFKVIGLSLARTIRPY